MNPSERSSLVLCLLAAATTLASAACDEPIRGGAARIAVKPSEIIFYGATPRVQPYEVELRIANIGSLPLRLARMQLRGDDRFSFDEATAMLQEVEKSNRRAMNSILSVGDTLERARAATISNIRRM